MTTLSVTKHFQSHVWCDTFRCVTWRIHICDVTHSYVWHDSSIRVTETWPIQLCDWARSCMWHDASIYVCESTIRVMWHIRTCDVTQSLSFICLTWRIHICDVTLSYMWRDLYIYVYIGTHTQAQTHTHTHTHTIMLNKTCPQHVDSKKTSQHIYITCFYPPINNS